MEIHRWHPGEITDLADPAAVEHLTRRPSGASVIAATSLATPKRSFNPAQEHEGYDNSMDSEFVFSVAMDKATAAKAITLAEAGLRERNHLQEWIIAHPEILGEHTMIITSEFDKWASATGIERHRPDVIALDADGHLVVVELKRDAAPDTVEMQAIKYAANASRFTLDVLAEAHATFLKRTGAEDLTNEEASAKITGHAESLAESEDSLRRPRMVLIAGSFPTSVTATAVWLTEMGISIRLVKVQAYKAPNDTIVTISQLWPLAEAEDFVVAPVRDAKKNRGSAPLPDAAWTGDDLANLKDNVDNRTIHTALDLCSQEPDTWVSSSAIQTASGRETTKHRGDFGGFGVTLRQRFARSNSPLETKWGAGGKKEQYYRVSTDTAEMWKAAGAEVKLADTNTETESDK